MNIFVDLDGTLCDDSHRALFANARLWDEYHEGIPDDKPNAHLCKLLRLMSDAGAMVIGLTARPERYRKVTLDWLEKHDVILDILLMRPEENYNPAPKLKLELLQEFYEEDHEVALVMTWAIFEDRDDVCEALRNEGFNVLQTKISVRSAG